MRASLNYLGLWAASAVAAVAAAAAEAAAGPTTSLTLQIGQPRLSAPAQQGGAASASADGFQAVLNGVPSWTRATLEAGGGRQYVSAPVTAIGQLVFANVTTGSYLAEVHCATHIFPPMRVDIAVDPSATGPAPPLFIAASETYRGNDWGNRGEALVRLDSVDTAVQSGRPASTYQSPTFVVRPFSALPKAYYTERSSFSALSILRNPMILLAMVSMAIMFGMPYLIDNMDPEMRREFEEQQKSSPMSGLLGSAGGGGGAAKPSFDMAAYLAGSNSGGSGSGSANANTNSGSGNSNSGGNGGSKKNGRR